MDVNAIAEAILAQDRLGKPREALLYVQGLALALSDSGQNANSLAVYCDALERAQRIGDPALLSQVRRNLGLLFADLNQDQRAETELISAVEDAKKSSNSEMLARSQLTLAIFCQHLNRLLEARLLLVEGLQKLNPAHPDAVVGQIHLEALEAGKICGCGDQAEGLAATFRGFLIRRLQSDLLDDLDVSLENSNFKIGLRLRRQPIQEEMDRMNSIITEAIADFRRRVTRR